MNHTKAVLIQSVLVLLTPVWIACAPVKQESPDRHGEYHVDESYHSVRLETLKLIHSILEEDLADGISLALVEGNRIRWSESFGYADRQNGRLTTTDTVFRIGSLTKPITALAVLRLASEKQISLDGPVSQQMNGFGLMDPNLAYQQITPRQLLSHRSGLPSDLRKGMYTHDGFQTVTRLLHDEYLAYLPDRAYVYSNLGYDVLGDLIEQKSKLAYQTYLTRQLFEPLGMRTARFQRSSEIADRLASGHIDGEVYDQPPLRDIPALGMYASSEDLAKLMMALLQQRVPGLERRFYAEMWRPQTAEGQVLMGIEPGLGWFIEQDEMLGKVVRHGGSTLMFSSEMALLPNAGLGVVVLSNRQDTDRIVRQIAATMLMLALQNSPEMQPTPDRPADQIPLVTKMPATGGYATDLGLIMIDPEKPRLCACIIERMLDLVRFEDGSMGLSEQSARDLPEPYQVLGELRFKVHEVDGAELLLAERDGKEVVLGSRIDDYRLEQQWRDRLGSYRTINPDTSYNVEDLELSIESGVLCLHYRVPHLSDQLIRVPLKPVSATEAIIEGFGRGRGERVRFVDMDGKQCLRYSGYIGEPVN